MPRRLAQALREVARTADAIERLGVAMSGEDDTARPVCSPDRVIRQCRPVLRRVADPFPVRVSLVPGARIGMTAGALERVVINLVRNARAAVDERGLILVAIRREGDAGTDTARCVVEVEDSGGEREIPSGQGLGLHIVDELVGNAGGLVEVLRDRGPGWVVCCSFPELS